MKNKHLLSLLAVGFFVFLALASKVNKIHYGAFNYKNAVEEKSEKGDYLDLTNGTRVYGKNIQWKSGLLVKDVVKIDDQSFKFGEVKGLRMGDTYYGRLGKTFIQRIVHGKINVYVHMYQVTTTSTSSAGFVRTSSYTRTDHYAQKGEDGPLEVFAGQKDIKRLVADCPIAVQMADIGNGKMRKSIRKNRDYLNQIFEIYNNDCQPLSVNFY
ncbi:MAG: hypothetical protein JNN29_08765 [Chitinophagaceae bacterium]|nr:hypothetical protein [Chitinophagaceae bacterium]MBN8666026.1 hypothetical protein [Chitinophagales bacterium]